jgi:hypothetical protein
MRRGAGRMARTLQILSRSLKQPVNHTSSMAGLYYLDFQYSRTDPGTAPTSAYPELPPVQKSFR